MGWTEEAVEREWLRAIKEASPRAEVLLLRLMGSGGGGNPEGGSATSTPQDEDSDEETGMRKMLKKLDPSKPTDEERREHELTHLPFRSWCRHCVRGRGREEYCGAQK